MNFVTNKLKYATHASRKMVIFVKMAGYIKLRGSIKTFIYKNCRPIFNFYICYTNNTQI